MSTMRLLAAWNRDFSPPAKRRENIRHAMRRNMRKVASGRGNAAWNRIDDMRRGTLDVGVAILYPQ